MQPIEIKYAKMWITNGILYCTYKKMDEVNLEIAKVGAKNRIEYSNNVSYPCLFDIRLLKSITKEARDYLADKGNELVAASALLVESALIRVIANFFITVNKPKNPTRIFTNENEAIRWLEKYKTPLPFPKKCC